MGNIDDLELVGDGCIAFIDGDVAVNSTLLSNTSSIPRVGEDVSLPGEKGDGRGIYRVKRVLHFYRETVNTEIPAAARLVRVNVLIEKAKP